MDTLLGLPAHPLLVHIPVVLVPLALLGAIGMALRKVWYERFKWVVLAIGVVGAIGAALAASAGESLEGDIVRAEGSGARASFEDHAEMGETARNFALLFMVVLAAWVLVPWFLAWRAGRTNSAATLSAAAAEAPATGETSTAGHGPKWLRPVLLVATLITGVVAVVTIVDAGHSGADSVWSELEEGGG